MNRARPERAVAVVAILAAITYISSVNQLVACQVPATLVDARIEIVALVNDFRTASRRKPVIRIGPLDNAAQDNACQMADAGRISHTGTGGSSAGERVAAAGYAWRFVAENVAAGFPSGREVFSGWKASRGHKTNMLNRRAAEIGVGWAVMDGTAYWVMVLAAPG